MDIFTKITWATKILTISILLIVWYRRWKGKTIRQQSFAVGAIFFVQLASLITYYAAWWHRLASNQVTKYLLWPKSNYLVVHVSSDLKALIAAWVVGALILWFLGWWFVKRGGERMLDRSDVGLLFFMTVAVGWPSFFIAFAMVFALAILLMFVLLILRKKSLHDRLVISPVIIPAAIMTIVFQEYLLTLTHLTKIGF